jgi:putative DNA primase/helicase
VSARAGRRVFRPELYTDDDEVLFVATRPIVLNGIEEGATRGDLMSRALLVELPTISPKRRMEEEAFWAAVDAARPALVGALLGCGRRGSP